MDHVPADLDDDDEDGEDVDEQLDDEDDTGETAGPVVRRGLGIDRRDVDLATGVIHVERQTYPGKGGLVTKRTKGRRRRVVPIIDHLRPTSERLVTGRVENERLVSGPRGGVVTTATLRDATRWDDVVRRLGLAGLVRHGLRHTALTWMADSKGQLYVLQRVAGHQDPAVTSRYLHPDMRAVVEAGSALSAWRKQSRGNSQDQDPRHPAGSAREGGA